MPLPVQCIGWSAPRSRAREHVAPLGGLAVDHHSLCNAASPIEHSEPKSKIKTTTRRVFCREPAYVTQLETGCLPSFFAVALRANHGVLCRRCSSQDVERNCDVTPSLTVCCIGPSGGVALKQTAPVVVWYSFDHPLAWHTPNRDRARSGMQRSRVLQSSWKAGEASRRGQARRIIRHVYLEPKPAFGSILRTQTDNKYTARILKVSRSALPAGRLQQQQQQMYMTERSRARAGATT